jgi:Kef-type K+ transport system membrane component KefB
MTKLTHHELIALLISISIMLIFSRVLAELGKKLKLPVVMGELLVGILLGPTVMGMLMPDAFYYLFPRTGNLTYAFDGLFSLSVIMLLFVAGMEVQMQLVKTGTNCYFNQLIQHVYSLFNRFCSSLVLARNIWDQ